jgi:hypothetical protein
MQSYEAGRTAQPTWRKATFCASGECIEVSQQSGAILVRDSVQPHGTVLTYQASDWQTLVRSIKDGALDSLGS